MDIRDFKYSDYGITKADERKVLDYCRNTPNENYIKAAISNANPDITEQLYKSLVHRASHETMDRAGEMCMEPKSFYAYRRKAIYEIYCLITLLGE